MAIGFHSRCRRCSTLGIKLCTLFIVLWSLAASDMLQFPVSTCNAYPVNDQGNQHLKPGDTFDVRDYDDRRREEEQRSIAEDETNVAALQLMKEILDKASEKSNVMENNEKEWVQSVLDEYGARFGEYARYKREILKTGNLSSSVVPRTSEIASLKLGEVRLVENKTIVCQLTTGTTAPMDRMGHLTARWTTIVAGILIVILLILILIFYCRCKARFVGYFRGAWRDNRRGTVSRGRQRPPVLNNQPPLNNSSFGLYANPNFDHHRAPPGRHGYGNYHYLKALEKHPELRASELMLDS